MENHHDYKNGGKSPFEKWWEVAVRQTEKIAILENVKIPADTKE